ncbi:hypothetical protein PUR61_44915 [Streptomyces sp. BE20]|uniref:DUF6932 family protein n=1 Tax=Streptomyces sp. BE20 TaxID=3002525 RepID=UPI002E7A7E3B|nr:hypothetical protein [Streptomyces sp. BE20]MEE1829259.1 hypothetical protein [Streptomyces sp. BE20]
MSVELRWEADGHLRPGRYQVDLEEAESLLVHDPQFAGSPTRVDIWNGLERYLVRFWSLENDYQSVLGGRSLVDRLWLGGSFVSSRFDPNNIDLTVFIDHEAESLLRNREGAGWLTKAFERKKALEEFRVSPLPVRYHKVVSPFRLKELSQVERDYLAGRGGWDDWWQRRRASDHVKDGPTVETVRPVRGYLEVTL